MLTPTEKLQLKHFLSLSHYVWFYTYWEAFSASTAVFYLIAIIFTSPVSCVRWCTHSKTEQRKNTSAIMKDSN